MKQGRFFVALLAAGCFLFACWLLRDRMRDFAVDDTRYADQIRAAAERHGLNPELVRAVVFRESRFDPEVRGKAGEIGLMQVLPSGAGAEWARQNGKPEPTARELKDPERNLDIGCWFLAQGMRRYAEFREADELALARYNAGQSRADKWRPAAKDGSVVDRITIKSTRHYVTGIMQRYRKYLKIDERRVPPEPAAGE